MMFLLLSSVVLADMPEYTYLEAGMEAPFSGRLFNDAQHKYDKGVLAAKIETQQKTIEELEELKTPSKKELWFSLGLVSGVALTISIAKAVQ